MAYKIAHHRLLSDHVQHESTEKNSGTFAGGFPDTLVFHASGTGSLQSAVQYLLDAEVKASAHLLIGRNGSIVQLMPFDRIAWHAGVSEYQGRTDLNRYALGIELENAGRLIRSGDQYIAWFGRAYGEEDIIQAVHPGESQVSYWHRYTEAQISTVLEVCRVLLSEYDIGALVGHDELAVDSKTAPGPAFPMKMIRHRLLLDDRQEGVDRFSRLSQAGVLQQGDIPLLTGPDQHSPPVEFNKIPQGTNVDIKGETNDYYRVSVPVEGWLRKDSVKAANQQLFLQDVIDV